MKYVRPLEPAEEEQLEQMRHSGNNDRERMRAHALLLSARGYHLDVLADIFSVNRDTLSHWIDRFHRSGVQGLRDASKSGRPSKLTAWGVEVIRQQLEHPTPNLKPLLLERLKKGA